MNPEQAYPPVGNFVTVDGVRLHYKRAGEGAPLVLIHGASGNLRDWDFGAHAAFAKTHDTIAFDRPGFGYSERPDGAADPAVQAGLLQKASALLGQDRPVVMGHSYGGVVALAWGVFIPETARGLVLLSAPSHVWEGPLNRRYLIGSGRVFGPFIRRIYHYFATPPRIRREVGVIFAPQDVPEAYVETMGVELALRADTLKANAEDIIHMRDYLAKMEPRYIALNLPVEILHGTADRIVSPRIHSDILAEKLPNARYSRIDGLGHMPHHSHLAQVLEILNRMDARD